MYHALYGIMDYVNEFGVIRAKQLYKFQNGRFFGTCHTSMVFFLVAVNISSHSCFCAFYKSIASISSRNKESTPYQ